MGGGLLVASWLVAKLPGGEMTSNPQGGASPYKTVLSTPSGVFRAFYLGAL